MSLKRGTRLRNGKVLTLHLKHLLPILSLWRKNSVDIDTKENYDIPTQLAEIRENYERKISDLQSDFSQLKDLMMALLKKWDNEYHHASEKGPSKQPKLGFGLVTEVTDTLSTRPPPTFQFNTRHYHNDESDDDEDSTPRSNGERLLNAIETIPQRIEATTTKTKLLQTHDWTNWKYQFQGDRKINFWNFNTCSSTISTHNLRTRILKKINSTSSTDYSETKQLSTGKRSKSALRHSKMSSTSLEKKLLKKTWKRWNVTNQARYDPTSEIFSDFLKSTNKTGKHAFVTEADKVIRRFLFGKLPGEIQQVLTMTNKDESSSEEIEICLMRKYQHQ